VKDIAMHKRFSFLVVGYFVFVSLFVNAESSYSPYIGRDFPTSVFWGDTHLHTNLSVDANGMSNKVRTPDDAYRFAKGEVVIGHNGMDTSSLALNYQA